MTPSCEQCKIAGLLAMFAGHHDSGQICRTVLQNVGQLESMIASSLLSRHQMKPESEIVGGSQQLTPVVARTRSRAKLFKLNRNHRYWGCTRLALISYYFMFFASLQEVLATDEKKALHLFMQNC
jgi:hypothetical protein